MKKINFQNFKKNDEKRGKIEKEEEATRQQRLGTPVKGKNIIKTTL